jgi:hypothetical protein
MSAVRKVALLARPMAGPVRVSTSSTVRSSSTIACSTLPMPKEPMRLPMKFGVSLQRTTALPITWSAKASIAASTSGFVCFPGIVSSSFR